MIKKGLVKKIGEYTFRYLHHESLMDFEAFVAEETAKNLNEHNLNAYISMVGRAEKRFSEDSWFGGPVSGIRELEEYTEFQYPDLIKIVEEEIKGSMDEFLKLELINEAEIKKISYNSFGLGIFSFDRAAMGLHKVKNTEGEIKVATSVKDVYAYFIKKLIPRQSVKIYIAAGANAGIRGKDMLYTGMSAVVLADFLQQKDYSVEISIIFESQNRNINVLQEVTVKKFTDTLDKNLISVLSSDPKYYRFKGFKSIIAGYNSFGLSCPKGLGGMVPLEHLRSFFLSENPTGSTPIVLGKSYSLEEAKNSIIKVINKLKQIENATGESNN